MSEANQAVFARGMAAFSQGDTATLTEVFADDVVWHVAGDNLISGPYEGRDATFAMFGRLTELTDGTYAVAAEAVSSDGDDVIVRLRPTAKREGRTLDMAITVRFSFADGQIVRTSETVDDPEAWDAFWS